MATTGGEPESQTRRAAAVARRELTRVELPGWLRTLGLGAWFTLGILVARS